MLVWLLADLSFARALLTQRHAGPASWVGLRVHLLWIGCQHTWAQSSSLLTSGDAGPPESLCPSAALRGGRDDFFSPNTMMYFCVSFLQVAGVSSKFRPMACTYRSDPYSCLAYGTAPFGPIECKQLLMECLVSLCIQDASLRIWLVLTRFLFLR